MLEKLSVHMQKKVTRLYFLLYKKSTQNGSKRFKYKALDHENTGRKQGKCFGTFHWAKSFIFSKSKH
jgi:hypothetical protein